MTHNLPDHPHRLEVRGPGDNRSGCDFASGTAAYDVFRSVRGYYRSELHPHSGVRLVLLDKDSSHHTAGRI